MERHRAGEETVGVWLSSVGHNQTEVDALSDETLLPRKVCCNISNFYLKDEESDISLCLSTYKDQKESILERQHSYSNFSTAYGQKFRHCIFPNDMGSYEEEQQPTS